VNVRQNKKPENSRYRVQVKPWNYESKGFVTLRSFYKSLLIFISAYQASDNERLSD
jgi:hypothetical protein